jgi:hypothetical protein
MQIVIKKNGAYWNTFTSNSSGYINFTYSEGYSNIQFEAQQDTTVPTISIQLPQNTTYASTSRTLNYTVSDNNAIDKCWYQYNGTNTTLANCANTTFIAINNNQSALVLYANDTSGNINSTNVTFTIDTTYPQISFSGGTESNNSYQSRNWIYANVSIIETNFQNLTFYLYNSTNLINSTLFSNSTRSRNWTNLAEGIYYFNATVYDSAGTQIIRKQEK